jgi:uncharacterized protein (DUF1684 family)
MRITYFILAGFFGILLFSGCSNSDQKDNAQYKNEIKEWRKKRLKNLKSEDGWLNLAGLYWLEKGKNTIGSDSSNDVVFPDKSPENLGYVRLKNDEVTFHTKEGAIVANKAGEQVKQTKMNHDQEKNTTILQHGPLKWFIIKRDDKLGIRLRDLMSPLLKKLDSIPAFPVKPGWKVEAEFIPYKQKRFMEVPNVLGGTYKEQVHGKLKFKIEDTTYTLLPMGDRKHLFLVFGDQTNAEETYGGGRFLSVPAPDESNKTIIDFNKAYNPPCAFTPYATCPLPPRENFLPVKIKAGEKSPGLEVHH